MPTAFACWRAASRSVDTGSTGSREGIDAPALAGYTVPVYDPYESDLGTLGNVRHGEDGYKGERMPRRRDRGDSAEEATIRAAARRAVDERGGRQVAREVGVVPNNLDQFIRGSYPYPRTWDKLRAWMLRAGEGEASRTARGTDAEPVRAALEMLVQRIASPRQGDARARLVALLGEVAQEPGLPAPAWLVGLEGGAEAYSAAPPAAALLVDVRGGRQVALPAPEDSEAARAMAEEMARVAGLWDGRVYYPPHAVFRVRLWP